jgi:Zn-dependent peptidase ImmA (M78 family)
MRIPSEVKIGTQVYEIVLRKRDDDGMLNDGNYGYTLDTQNLIVIDKSLPATKQRTTLVHELMHAFSFVFERSTRPTKRDDYETWEHHFIGIYEETWIMVLKENPELLAYLTA